MSKKEIVQEAIQKMLNKYTAKPSRMAAIGIPAGMLFGAALPFTGGREKTWKDRAISAAAMGALGSAPAIHQWMLRRSAPKYGKELLRFHQSIGRLESGWKRLSELAQKAKLKGYGKDGKRLAMHFIDKASIGPASGIESAARFLLPAGGALAGGLMGDGDWTDRAGKALFGATAGYAAARLSAPLLNYAVHDMPLGEQLIRGLQYNRTLVKERIADFMRRDAKKLREAYNAAKSQASKIKKAAHFALSI